MGGKAAGEVPSAVWGQTGCKRPVPGLARLSVQASGTLFLSHAGCPPHPNFLVPLFRHLLF